MADTPEIGRNTFRGPSNGCFSSGRGYRAAGIASCRPLGIEAAHRLRSAGPVVAMNFCAHWTGRVSVLGHFAGGSRRGRGMMQRSSQDEGHPSWRKSWNDADTSI
jgi:hypothetical protein